MGKIDRLISIVMILLQKDVVSTTQLSKILNVSKRTILRDMETLSLSKVPIYSINGVNGGYGIMDEYKIDKHLLTNTDIENILTALNGLEQILFSKEVEATIYKIQAMVNSSFLKNTIHLSFYDWSGRQEILNVCRICQEAILKNRLVSFDYSDRNGILTNRIVEPYQLHFSEMSWYLKAFCLKRNEYRTFKLSRTENLSINKGSFVPRDYLDYQKSEEAYNSQLVQVKALISPSIKDHFIERYGKMSIETYNSDFLLATIYLPQDSIGYQFLASFGSKLEIIEPKSYVENYRRFLCELLEKYQ
ncbi:helix-turn-helix transcriptional regulator [Lachnoclostridium sp.]|uniref:helix-turn-helix transcriptional regulator n=1 Tax=Lachnoclostridium sp. TaxID=2028282 RepID=UPI002898518D|nr:YafY family protein [Lachnoclostridium sp.]